MPVDVPRDITSLNDYINDKLMRRMDIVEADSANDLIRNTDHQSEAVI